MNFGDASDFTIWLAVVVGLGALLLALLFIAYLFILRLLLNARRRHARAVARKWRPRLLSVAAGEPLTGDWRVPAREREEVLHAWNKLQSSLRGEVKGELNALLAATGLDAQCREWLNSRWQPRRRLLAILALGHFAQEQDWSRLLPLLDDPQPYLSVSALRALMRIDPQRAATEALTRLGRRPDWPRGTVLVAFQEAGAGNVTEPLSRWLENAPSDELALGLPLLQTADASRMEAPLLGMLAADRPIDLIAGALKLVDTPAALPAVRALCRHPAWQVRTQAAIALGRLRQPDDRSFLLPMLGDAYWWVRYRAAQALLSLPGTSDASVNADLQALPDRYARDILRQVAWESGLITGTPS